MTVSEQPAGNGATRLNFIVAFCAILISAASFYATYLQANSAKQQVKAMTWPLIEFTHGNFDVATQKKVITFTLKNAGVGPAIVKTVRYQFDDARYANLNDFLRACCAAEGAAFMQSTKDDTSDNNAWTLTTAVAEDIILPVGGQLDFLTLAEGPVNASLWNALDRARWSLSLDICYCSLLENCYVTSKPGTVVDVAACAERDEQR